MELNSYSSTNNPVSCDFQLYKAIPIGSTTAGADGNIALFKLPGDVSAVFSGLGVFYPDGTQTQRVGIKINTIITPTLKAVREGKDELIERAVSLIEK